MEERTVFSRKASIKIKDQKSFALNQKSNAPRKPNFQNAQKTFFHTGFV